MGSLEKLWTELPGGDEEEFKRHFAWFFDASWHQLMVGAEKPYDMHLYWDAYFSVCKITPVSGFTLADLARPGRELTRLNIVAG